MIFHVYSRTQLIEMDSNKTSMRLTVALFIFTVVRVVTLYFDLRDYKVRNPDHKPPKRPINPKRRPK
jgi:hypothetical protein